MNPVSPVSAASCWSVSDQSAWVSVKDRMPEQGKEVLVFSKEKIWIASYSVNGWEVLLGVKIGNVSHWAYLPGAPDGL